MMSDIKGLSEQFKFMYKKFINGCDAIAETDHWDKEEYGEMEAYYI